jgi:hypothetical protein
VLQLPSDWTFFGLTSNYKVHIQEQIFDLVYYGKGFSYSEVRDMPIYIRTFFIRRLTKIFDDRRKAEEKQLKLAKSRIPKK